MDEESRRTADAIVGRRRSAGRRRQDHETLRSAWIQPLGSGISDSFVLLEALPHGDVHLVVFRDPLYEDANLFGRRPWYPATAPQSISITARCTRKRYRRNDEGLLIERRLRMQQNTASRFSGPGRAVFLTLAKIPGSMKEKL